ncbi:MAG: hypothetical protein Q9181_002595 [Wetmoreana brouardii]
MSMATALTWFFNFLLAVTFPKFQDAFQNTGAFGYYAAWCVVGWVLILLFVPETKDLTLEQLDARFSIQSKSHAKYALKQCLFVIRHYVLRRQHVKRPIMELPPQEDDYGHREAEPRKISLEKDQRTNVFLEVIELWNLSGFFGYVEKLEQRGVHRCPEFEYSSHLAFFLASGPKAVRAVGELIPALRFSPKPSAHRRAREMNHNLQRNQRRGHQQHTITIGSQIRALLLRAHMMSLPLCSRGAVIPTSATPLCPFIRTRRLRQRDKAASPFRDTTSQDSE